MLIKQLPLNYDWWLDRNIITAVEKNKLVTAQILFNASDKSQVIKELLDKLYRSSSIPAQSQIIYKAVVYLTHDCTFEEIKDYFLMAIELYQRRKSLKERGRVYASVLLPWTRLVSSSLTQA